MTDHPDGTSCTGRDRCTILMGIFLRRACFGGVGVSLFTSRTLVFTCVFASSTPVLQMPCNRTCPDRMPCNRAAGLAI